MAKKPKKKPAGRKKPAKSVKPRGKEPGPGIGARLKGAFSRSPKRGDGTPNDDLYLDMLDAGLLDGGEGGNPDHPEVAEAKVETETEVVVEDDGDRWPDQRLMIAQKIWGDDFIKPGGEKDVVELIRPLALTSDHTVLDIGAGLGGSSRAIAHSSGAWVSGFEVDQGLAKAAMTRSKMAGMERKAPILELPLDGPELKPKSANAMFSKEALYKIEDKERLLDGVDNILRSQSQVMLTDYISAEADQDTPDLQTWLAHERTTPSLWTLDRYRDYFSKLSYNIYVAEDITSKYYSHVVTGFTEFSNTIKEFRGDKEMEAWTVKEAEFWVRRMAPFESGALRVCRIHAQKP